MLALVKRVSNGKMDIVPTEEIYLVKKKKKNGVKRLKPFKPTGASDFRPDRKKKYVVLKEKRGEMRRWYIMIGCMAGSVNKVVKRASKVSWFAKGDESPVKSMEVEESPDEMSAEAEESPAKSTKQAIIDTHEAYKANQFKGVLMRLASLEKAEYLQAQKINSILEQLEAPQATNASDKVCEQSIPGLESMVEEAVVGTVKKEIVKVEQHCQDVFSKCLTALFDRIRKEGKMKPVLEWVNNIPSELDTSMALSEANKTDASAAAKIESSADDTVENISEASWEKAILTQPAMDTTTTVSDSPDK